MFFSRVIFITLTMLFCFQYSFAKDPNQTECLSEKQIIKATWSMYAWKVLGWRYDSPSWTKGNEETGQIGQKGQIERKRNIRAVCLGAEGDFYVFFTLRSFVDPVFPNLFIQNVSDIPLNFNGKPFSESEIASQSYIRYGGVSLVFYEDVGGGTVKIDRKVIGITHFDEKNPKCYGRYSVRRFIPGSGYYETIDNVKYERPHEKISAQEHLEFRKSPKIVIKFVSDHDVALLYVPKLVFKGSAITTLEINNPTLSVKLMLGHNRELFGFKFVLIGQETIDLVKNYVANKNEESFKGFQKLLTVAGLALNIDTLNMVKAIDSTLDSVIPDRLMDARDRFEIGKIAWEELGLLAINIVNDKRTLTKIKSHLTPIISRSPIQSLQ